VAIAIGLIKGNTGGGSADPPSNPPGSTASSPSSGSTTGATVETMKTFTADYLATVTQSPRTTFAELTPEFKTESGGFSGYSRFWKTIRSARLTTFSADPKALTVTYEVAYVHTDGSETNDDVTLDLTYEGGKYLISGDS
jgi:eukaryotic-like serine/threonine-protein kinase